MGNVVKLCVLYGCRSSDFNCTVSVVSIDVCASTVSFISIGCVVNFSSFFCVICCGFVANNFISIVIGHSYGVGVCIGNCISYVVACTVLNCGVVSIRWI